MSPNATAGFGLLAACAGAPFPDAPFRGAPFERGLQRLIETVRAGLPGIMPLRIDVAHDPHGLQADLDALERRMRRAGDPLHGLPTLGIARPGFRFRHREADGEHYVYVEDTVRGCLAGCTVFNRLVELDRQTAQHLRSPHSRYAPAYQRRGLASLVYRWWLDSQGSLVSGARQSPAAHGLWHAMSRHYPIGYARIENRRLDWLGSEVDPQTREALNTRLVLLGSRSKIGDTSCPGDARPDHRPALARINR